MSTLDRRSFYDQRAPFRPKELERGYHRWLKACFAFLVPPDLRVLEIGCGLGDLLAAVKPQRGVGIDFSSAMIEMAQAQHPELEFHVAAASEYRSDEKFDYILLSDLVADLPDVQTVLEGLQRNATSNTRLVLNFCNNLWRPLLALAEKIGLKSPTLPQNWLTLQDISNLLRLTGWEIIKTDARILWPIKTPFLGAFLNRCLAPLLRPFCLTTFVVARPRPVPAQNRHYACSVVVPAQNAAANIESVVLRTPRMGTGTEIIFVEGNSHDNTWGEIQRVIEKYPYRQIRALKQCSADKAGALREGFAEATGDLLFILEPDLSIPPEELVRFYDVARSGLADFVNGVRFVYPVGNKAMNILKMAVYKFFNVAFGRILGQPVKDTFCGTKVLFRTDYELMAQNRWYFGNFDHYGDYELLFGAAKMNLRIVDLPVRCEVTAGPHAGPSSSKQLLLLARMALFGLRKLVFWG